MDIRNPLASRVSAAEKYLDIDLRQYMLRVYNYMTAGLALSAVVAYFFGTPLRAENPADATFFLSIPLPAISMIANILLLIAVFTLVIKSSRGTLTVGTAKVLFWSICTLMGVSLTYIFALYTAHGILLSLSVTAASFAGLSLYGYTTKRDLSAIGTFAVMALWGIIILSLVNLFVRNTAMDNIISFAGIFIFAALTAYDTQRIKDLYFSLPERGEAATTAVILGALNLYLDFINLFLFLLRFLGDRR